MKNHERFKTSEACQKKIIDFLPGFERSPRVKFKSSKDERTAFNKANLKNSKSELVSDLESQIFWSGYQTKV